MTIPLISGSMATNKFSNLAGTGQITTNLTTVDSDVLALFFISCWTNASSSASRTVTNFNFGALGNPNSRYTKFQRYTTTNEWHYLGVFWKRIPNPDTYSNLAFSVSGGTGAASCILTAIMFKDVDWDAGPFDAGVGGVNPAHAEKITSTAGLLTCTPSKTRDNVVTIGAQTSFNLVVAGEGSGFTRDNLDGATGVQQVVEHKDGGNTVSFTGNQTSIIQYGDLITGTNNPPVRRKVIIPHQYAA